MNLAARPSGQGLGHGMRWPYLWLPAAALPLSGRFAELRHDDLVAAAHDLAAGRLNCSASGRQGLALDALRHYGAVLNSCFAAGLTRAPASGGLTRA